MTRALFALCIVNCALCILAAAAEPTRNFFEGGAFELWDESGPKVVGIGLWGRTEGGKPITAHDWTGTTLPTDWRPLRATALVPEDATLLIVQLHCASGWGETGEAFFDDVALRVLPEHDKTGDAPEPVSPEEAFRASFVNQPAVVSDTWQRPAAAEGLADLFAGEVRFGEDGRERGAPGRRGCARGPRSSGRIRIPYR